MMKPTLVADLDKAFSCVEICVWFVYADSFIRGLANLLKALLIKASFKCTSSSLPGDYSNRHLHRQRHNTAQRLSLPFSLAHFQL